MNSYDRFVAFTQANQNSLSTLEVIISFPSTLEVVVDLIAIAVIRSALC